MLTLAFLPILLPIAGICAEIRSDWEEIRNQYDSGNYEQALQLIDQVEDQGHHYYYNLGSIHFRLSHIGLAVAFLEKANHLYPYDPDTRHNLKLAQNALQSINGSLNLDPASSWLEFLVDSVALEQLEAVIGILLAMLISLWVRPYIRTRSLRAALLSTGSTLCISALLLALLVLGAKVLALSDPPAVLLKTEIIRSGPSDRFLELARVPVGVKLRLAGQEAKETSDRGLKWVQVSFAPGSKGWVPSDSLLLLQTHWHKPSS